jgi:hypothetical protein
MKVSGQLHVPAALPPMKEPLGPRAGLEAVVRRKIPIPLPGLKPPTSQPVAQSYTTELSRLLFQWGNIDLNLYTELRNR